MNGRNLEQKRAGEEQTAKEEGEAGETAGKEAE